MPSPAESLRQLASQGLLRGQRPLDSPAGVQVVRDGRTLWNFASNDYLGLARHPEIEAALVEGVHRFGAGSAASPRTGFAAASRANSDARASPPRPVANWPRNPRREAGDAVR